nr:hypothetical protein [Micromonospora sp. DSM 115978]
CTGPTKITGGTFCDTLHIGCVKDIPVIFSKITFPLEFRILGKSQAGGVISLLQEIHRKSKYEVATLGVAT